MTHKWQALTTWAVAGAVSGRVGQPRSRGVTRRILVGYASRARLTHPTTDFPESDFWVMHGRGLEPVAPCDGHPKRVSRRVTGQRRGRCRTVRQAGERVSHR